MLTVVKQNVKLADGFIPIHAGRIGTVWTGLKEFEQEFGAPMVELGPDKFNDPPKVSKIWTFLTPRGLIEVSDYWWNSPKELSIRATSDKAVLWFTTYLRGLSIKAGKGTQK